MEKNKGVVHFSQACGKDQVVAPIYSIHHAKDRGCSSLTLTHALCCCTHTHTLTHSHTTRFQHTRLLADPRV